MTIASPPTATAAILYGKVAGFHTDVDKLRSFFTDVVANAPSTPYFDHSVEYEGWSVTSRDGTTADGVKFVAGPKTPGAKNPPATVPTPLCRGAAAETLEQLKAVGMRFSRVRFMRLSSVNFDMRFHSDGPGGREQWRLHVPVITNPYSFFEWKLENGQVVRTHFPADGSAWLVRVDVQHRAVNQNPSPSKRVHLLMGVKMPPLESISEPYVMPAFGAAARPAAAPAEPAKPRIPAAVRD
ncbi:MAG TPA: hypothetical protein VH835_06915 [Dongiaceae bacterium]|jgi:hypothetical protein